MTQLLITDDRQPRTEFRRPNPKSKIQNHLSFGFLNSLMLAGLVALALPVIVHFLSKRRFDVVDWGAMQFLELGKRMRRRIRLQDLLLLAVRMGLLGLLVLGMSRPWAKGGPLSAFSPDDPRVYIGLGNLHRMYMMAPAQVDQLVEMMVQQVRSLPFSSRFLYFGEATGAMTSPNSSRAVQPAGGTFP